MSVQTEWLKKVIGLSIAPWCEEEKRERFAELEQEYNRFTVAERDMIRNLMETQLEVKDRIYVQSCLVQYMNIAEFRDFLLSSILEGSFDCSTEIMLELQVAATVKGTYMKKRMFHKKNMEHLAQLLGENHSYQPLAQRNKKRIAIITGQLLNTLHAPTKVVLNFAYMLQERLNYEVRIFVCPCDGDFPQDLWYEPHQMNASERWRNVPMRMTYEDTVFEGYQVNMTPASPKEYSMMLSLIHAWNPLFVLAMGVIHPVADLAARFTTLVSMGMSIDCPVSEGNILVRLDQADEESEKEYVERIGEKQTQLFIEEKMPVLVEKSQKTYSRLESGLPEDQFLIAIVGNRLDAEIDHEFVALMKRLLEREPNISFVMIGRVKKLKEYLAGAVFTDHVYYLGYSNDLAGAYGMLDLYLNPRRRGGGFSSMIALSEGVPVVSLPDCDVAYHAGEAFVVQNEEEMIETVCRYVSDQEYYEEKKRVAQMIAQRNTDDKMVEYVKNMVDHIIQIMEQQECE